MFNELLTDRIFIAPTLSSLYNNIMNYLRIPSIFNKLSLNAPAKMNHTPRALCFTLYKDLDKTRKYFYFRDNFMRLENKFRDLFKP